MIIWAYALGRRAIRHIISGLTIDAILHGLNHCWIVGRPMVTWHQRPVHAEIVARLRVQIHSLVLLQDGLYVHSATDSACTLDVKFGLSPLPTHIPLQDKPRICRQHEACTQDARVCL
jgi:hypothetical protein